MENDRIFFISGPRRSLTLGERLRIAAAAAVGLGILFAALVVSFSIALVLIPVAAIAYLFRRQILRAVLRRMGQPIDVPPAREAPGFRPDAAPHYGEGDVIDGEFRVVDEKDVRR